MSNPMYVLGFDCSSVNLGWVVWNRTSELVVDHALIKLGTSKDYIGFRIMAARDEALKLLRANEPGILAMEGPSMGSHEMVALQRVAAGIILAGVADGLLTVEVAPSSAKKALTDNGRASKELMKETAAHYFKRKFTEHEADALGVAFGALKKVNV
jgi:Holliday junction resolvasome RuvABC endonuclease subunit